MITFERAQVYYGQASHPRAAVWSAFPQQARRGAIVAARRVLSRALGRPMNDAEADYVEGDAKRDEYAVYEQALHMLESGQITGTVGADPLPVATSEEVRRPVRPDVFSPEALRWLGWTGAAIIRG